MYGSEGIICFQVQLMGQPVGFALNGGTTIPASTIGSDPEPSLVIVPKFMRNATAHEVPNTVQMIAVQLDNDYISYYCQLRNGTVVKFLE